MAGPGRILISTGKAAVAEEPLNVASALAVPKAHTPCPRASSLRDHSVGASDWVYLRCRATSISSSPGFPIVNSWPIQAYAGALRIISHQCPIVDLPNGSYQYVSTAPFKTRRRVVQGHWGWEQSCFHMYLMEQVHGALPSSCQICPGLQHGADAQLEQASQPSQMAMGRRPAHASPFTGSASVCYTQISSQVYPAPAALLVGPHTCSR